MALSRAGLTNPLIPIRLKATKYSRKPCVKVSQPPAASEEKDRYHLKGKGNPRA